MQSSPRATRTSAPLVRWAILAVFVLLLAAVAWWKGRGSGAVNGYDSLAHHYADQLLSLQIALVDNAQGYAPTLEGLRTGTLRLRGAGAWPSPPAGVTVFERPSKHSFCFAVRHASGAHWYVIYDDVGTGREMPDSREPADCP